MPKKKGRGSGLLNRPRQITAKRIAVRCALSDLFTSCSTIEAVAAEWWVVLCGCLPADGVGYMLRVHCTLYSGAG